MLTLLHEIGIKGCKLIASAFDSYRPELHYMRGPGPKWRARNSTNPSHPASLC